MPRVNRFLPCGLTICVGQTTIAGPDVFSHFAVATVLVSRLGNELDRKLKTRIGKVFETMVLVLLSGLPDDGTRTRLLAHLRLGLPVH